MVLDPIRRLVNHDESAYIWRASHVAGASVCGNGFKPSMTHMNHAGGGFGSQHGAVPGHAGPKQFCCKGCYRYAQATRAVTWTPGPVACNKPIMTRRFDYVRVYTLHV